jgi:hypothetical protein
MHVFVEFRNFFVEAPLKDDDWRLLVWSNEYLERNFKHAKHEDTFEGKTQTLVKEEFVGGDGTEIDISEGKGEDGKT